MSNVFLSWYSMDLQIKVLGWFASGVHNISQRPVAFHQACIAKPTFLNIKEHEKPKMCL